LLVAAGLAAAGTRIQVQPPRLALLAQHLGQLDALASWEFAGITLDALLEAYRQELQAAAGERRSSPERRAKLARWRHATADLAAQLQAARRRLDDGAPFSVYADSQHQVLIVVDGQPIAVSGPSLAADRRIEQAVIERFCAYNDCSPLTEDAGTALQPVRQPPAGWVFAEHSAPAFEIYGVLRCEFPDLSERARKAEACHQAAEEALRLAASLQGARQQGHRIDWEWLSAAPQARAIGGQVRVNREGAYFTLPSGMLAHLTAADWQALVDWLRDRDAGQPSSWVLRQADRLLVPAGDD
jgi:hypothetical protein